MKEILVKIEKALPFTEAVYPQLGRLLPQEQTVFALRHMLTHQLKSLAKYRRAPDANAELACELALNNFRFAQVVGLDEELLDAEVRRWERMNTVKRVYDSGAGERTTRLIATDTVGCLISFEPVDHGRDIKTILPGLWSSAQDFLTHSREFAEQRKITLSELSAWIDQFMVKHPV